MADQQNSPGPALGFYLQGGTGTFANKFYRLYRQSDSSAMFEGYLGAGDDVVAEPNASPPRISLKPENLGGENLTFEKGYGDSWDNLQFAWIPYVGNQPQPQYFRNWCVFNFSPPGASMTNGDKLTIERASQTFSGAEGFVRLVDSGGTSSQQSYRFTLRDQYGNMVDSVVDGARETVENVYETTGSGYLNVKEGQNITFTNESNDKWTDVSQVKCEVNYGTSSWALLDVATFESLDMPPQAELRITSLYHDLTY